MRMWPAGVVMRYELSVLRPDVVDVADHLVRRKRRRLILVGAHVAREDRSRRVRLPAHGDRGQVRGLLCEGESVAREERADQKSPKPVA